MTGATAHAESAARLAAGLTSDGDAGEAVKMLTRLGRDDLAAAVAELARMAIARNARVFPRGNTAKPELAPDWPAFWADAAIEARRADDAGWLANLMTANRPGSVNESMCLRVLLSAAAGTGEGAGA